jgi:trimeric autotransporter adhesin
MSADRSLSGCSGRWHSSTHKSRAGRGSSLWTAIGVLIFTVAGIAQRGPLPPTPIKDDLPDAVSARTGGTRTAAPRIGLPAAAQAQISAAIGGDDQEYHAIPLPDGFRLSNAQHALSAEFTGSGVEFTRAAYRWGLALRGVGYADALRGVDASAPQANANRVEYRRGALTEWYVNGPLGLEQGFTIERAPGKSTGDRLTLAFALSGNLTATVATDGRGLALSNDGAVALRYSGLTALDARGHELPARLEIVGTELRVRVDDSGAQYPITIDPYIQAEKLTTRWPSCDPAGVCDDGAPYDTFGMAVAISADGSTAVVGVPGKYTGAQFATGAAYLFLRPTDGRGWNSIYPNYYKAKLLARDSDRLANTSILGVSVDITRDGGYVVIGARGVSWIAGTPTTPGAAYLFKRPANGWGSTAVQTDWAKLTPTPAANVNEDGTFGTSVTISGDASSIVVGSPRHQLNGSYVGAAYLFYPRGSGWDDTRESQKIVGTNISFFGYAVSLSDDGRTLAVGSWNEAPAGGSSTRSGVVHVLARTPQPDSPDIFAEVARLKASDGIADDRLGFAVGIDGAGNTIVAGAPVGSTDEYPAAHKGSAYVFTKPAGGWANQLLSETAKFTASDGYPNDSFGLSVDISVDGKTIVAGAFQRPLFTGTPTGSGAAYLFSKPAAGWVTGTEKSKLLPADPVVGMWFGFSASITGDGSVAFIGAPWETIQYNPVQGAAYVFTAVPVAYPLPSSVEFPPQVIDTTSAPKTVTLMNTGNAPLHVVSVHTTHGSYLTTQNCIAASPIAPGASCAENVQFRPSAIGYVSGYLVFTDDSGGAVYTTQTVQLQGEGRKLNTTTTMTLPSNSVLVGQPVVVSFAVTPESGTQTPNGRVTVETNTGETCWANTDTGKGSITFTTVGDRIIRAVYGGNNYFNPSSSADTQLRVGDFSLSASPASQTISGRKATFTVTVGAVNGFTGAVSLSCAGGPVNTSCAMSPASISLAGSAKSAKATITLPVGASNGTYVFGFTGTSNGVSRGTTATLVVK